MRGLPSQTPTPSVSAIKTSAPKNPARKQDSEPQAESNAARTNPSEKGDWLESGRFVPVPFLPAPFAGTGQRTPQRQPAGVQRATSRPGWQTSTASRQSSAACQRSRPPLIPTPSSSPAPAASVRRPGLGRSPTSWAATGSDLDTIPLALGKFELGSDEYSIGLALQHIAPYCGPAIRCPPRSRGRSSARNSNRSWPRLTAARRTRSSPPGTIGKRRRG